MDTRIGGVDPPLVVGDWPPMLIPDELRKCVVFICCEVAGQTKAVGTGFFVGVGLERNPDRSVIYLVTAKHVIDGIRLKSSDGLVRVRLNGKLGGVRWANAPVALWKHDEDADPPTDLAALPFAPPEDQVDFRFWAFGSIATDEVIRAQHIGIGDEVVIAGLFVNHVGSQRNIPIVRIGNIAAMPEEPVLSAAGAMDAYLIEARSIGGLSGSPVFVNTGIDRSDQDAPNKLLTAASAVSSHLYLLGVMHGHWDAPVADDASRDAIVSVDGPGVERVNMGIAMVVPATKVIDLLNGSEFVEMRKKMDDAVDKDKAATPDSAVSDEDEFSNFEKLTRGLVNVSKDELDEKRKES